jgi:uncharacterized coiled-coil protein SlyX
VYRQQQEIDTLQQALQQLRLQVEQGPAMPGDARDEVPPHY